MSSMFTYEVLQARWHPRQYNILLALYNDNYLRVLNAENNSLQLTLSLGRHPYSALSTVIPLEENAKDFDFSLPIEKPAETRVLVLKGNGDVFHVVIGKNESRREEPMRFEMEKKSQSSVAPNSPSLSIMVLRSSPPVVVIANSTGLVSHCVLLREGRNQYLRVFEQYNIFEKEKIPRHGQNVILKDQTTVYRYFVLHAAGVHAVMIPLIPVLDQLLGLDCRGISPEKVTTAIRETDSIVRQLVDTQVGGMQVSRSLFGVGVLPVKVTKSQLLILPADGQPFIHEVDSLFPPATDYLNKFVTSVKGPKTEFSAVVSKYLLGNQSSKPPVIKVGDALRNASPEETLQFLRKYISNLKEDRLIKLKVVAELIDAKKRDNAIEFGYQLKQIDILMAEREELQQNAERIAERYEETNEKHMELQKRLEMVGLRINAPGISLSEEKMKSELQALNEKTRKLEIDFARTQALFESRNSFTVAQDAKSSKTSENTGNNKMTYLSDEKKKLIQQALTKMNKNIVEAQNRIMDLGVKLDSLKKL
ncbi:nuclear pore complex protein Nup88-like [Macrosteles quadrilineatus]|uniref:nuclear pore complex protein Nup88-like n=1 Tax=Macrosteles quadrilineatus TaxID=74068 RepID=UPI0023E27226|nr:nuclear pore complex protein Nup88-like [Macrosteles quadrilineatus]